MGSSNSTYKYNDDGSPINNFQFNNDDFEVPLEYGSDDYSMGSGRSLTPTNNEENSNNYSYEYEQGFQEGVRYALSYMEQQE
tara:strand:- start:726 stop:971 length:246 start_codon:yes stop_codon:yes gene_type:complete